MRQALATEVAQGRPAAIACLHDGGRVSGRRRDGQTAHHLPRGAIAARKLEKANVEHAAERAESTASVRVASRLYP
jgi:hypothetical protein